MASKEMLLRFLLSRSLEPVKITLSGKRDFAGLMKLRDLRRSILCYPGGP